MKIKVGQLWQHKANEFDVLEILQDHYPATYNYSDQETFVIEIDTETTFWVTHKKILNNYKLVSGPQ